MVLFACIIGFVGCGDSGGGDDDGGDISRFVAVGGTGEVMWSQDVSLGIWTDSITVSAELYGIAYGNERFVVVGSGVESMWSIDASEGSWTDSSPSVSVGFVNIACGP